MHPPVLPGLAILVAALLVAEGRGSRAGVWLTKPFAAAAYVWLAVAAGAAGSAYGWAVLVALVLSWWGDVLLIPRERQRVFRAGVLAFLAGHVAYAGAFVIRGVDAVVLVLALAAMAVPAFFVHRRLAHRVPADLKGAVTAYIVVISTMFALAVATHASAPALPIVFGAGMFWLSDLCVARDRFVKQGFVNRLVGLPLYFAAQVHLALSVGL
jgi:uncharacterized membrane protein YhhN